MNEPITVGLRVDVDTLRGTREGVVKLLALFDKYSIQASFFCCVGPDNMGRHLWRLLRPAFLKKMLRSKAASLYGWDILLQGTFWPGTVIGRKLAPIIKATADAGHEVGLHAWDHHAWQMRLEGWDREQIYEAIAKGVEGLTDILGTPPTCSAVAGWKCNEAVLLEKEKFPFTYNSDGRGDSIFRPVVKNNICTPQIPVTLPTYDEIIGQRGITNANYNAHLLSLLRPNALNVLTIHAEVEGIICADLFEQFLQQAQQRQVRFVPLVQLLPEQREQIPVGKIELQEIVGREGWVCVQAGARDV
ncbi:MAG: 4-deoxy-4-formamido-L-arabinose-phosphoundecaprenol deformylase [Thiotrichaceae bacterium]|nr:4-deoxy-4-formamido-L-arabinose-phosphoundecaprenol deformylase [Thiotrichaceae bacterium]